MAHSPRSPIGQAWLWRTLALPVPPPAVASSVGPGARRSLVGDAGIEAHFPQRYAPEDTMVGHLRFALRHEPLDPGVLVATFKMMDTAALEQWVRAEPILIGLRWSATILVALRARCPRSHVGERLRLASIVN